MAAVPLPMVLMDALQRAASQDPATMQPAVAELEALQAQPGFPVALQELFINVEVPTVVRQLAVLYFKNGLNRFWHRMSDSALPEQDRAAIRTRMQTAINEPEESVAVQLGVVFGQMARFDVPRHWPDLLPWLLTTAQQSQQPLQQRRCLAFAYRVVKAMASRRLPSQQRVFQEVAESSFRFLLDFWKTQLQAAVQASQNLQSMEQLKAASIQFESARTVLKTLRQLLVFGFKRFHENEAARELLFMSTQAIPMLLGLRKAVHNALSDVVDKTITLLGKLMLDAHARQPLSFAHFLRPILTLVCQQLAEGSSSDATQHERLVIVFMNLLVNVVQCSDYFPFAASRGSKVKLNLSGSTDAGDPEKVAAHAEVSGFFTPELITQLFQLLITRYLPLGSDDIEQWDASPEEFVFEETGDSWKFAVRPASEHLFKAMATAYKPVMCALVVQYIQETMAPPTDAASLVVKDAVYQAVGLCAYDLYDSIDFDSWFMETLLPQLLTPQPALRIVRRRILWLVGHWVSVRLAVESRLHLYRAIAMILSPPEDPSVPPEDLVIRITAAQTLALAIEDFDFRADDFAPFLEAIMVSVFRLLCDVRECDSKIKVLNVASSLINRYHNKIQSYTYNFVQYLPQLWVQAEPHNLLRCAIVRLMTRLVEALGPSAAALQEFLLPVIREGIDLTRESYVFLLEDALDLWHAIIKECVELTPPLLDLFCAMGPLLERGDDSVRVCVAIVDSYLLLSPVEFLQRFASDIVNICSNLVSTVPLTGLTVLCQTMDKMLVMFPGPAVEMLNPVLTQAIAGVLNVMPENGGVAAVYNTLLARLMVVSPAHFSLLLQQASQQARDDLVPFFWDQWLDRFDKLSSAKHRKLGAMGLAAVLCVPECCRYLLSRHVVTTMSVFAGALFEFHVRDGTFHPVDFLVLLCSDAIHGKDDDNCNDSAGTLENAEGLRKRQLASRDVVFVTSTRDFLATQLKALEAAMGPQAYQEMLKEVPPPLLNQLQPLFG
eukprot:m.489695 g.489695  ORF g.489695 m.489695 type:complete len:1003 (-) comp27025_c0_seq1:25-3033(-)